MSGFDADSVRRALAEVRAQFRVSDEKFVQLLGEYLKQNGITCTEISRATFNRFRTGQEIRNKEWIVHFVEMLNGHPIYGPYLKNNTLKNVSDSEPIHMAIQPHGQEVLAAFGASVKAFFEQNLDGRPVYDLSPQSYLAKKIVGSYSLFRPSWYPVEEARQKNSTKQINLIMVSRFNVWSEGDHLYASERQNFLIRSEQSAYHQFDVGTIWSYGRYIFFLLKEENGSSVKFGIIDRVVYGYHNEHVSTFCGFLFSCSRLRLYPVHPIFGRRANMGAPLDSGPFSFEEIADSEAKRYFRGETPV